MVSSTRNHLRYFELVDTESYFDQHIFCGSRGHRQNTKLLCDHNRHVFYNLCNYKQYTIDKYKVNVFVGSPNNYLFNLLHIRCSEFLHCEQIITFYTFITFMVSHSFKGLFIFMYVNPIELKKNQQEQQSLVVPSIYIYTQKSIMGLTKY